MFAHFFHTARFGLVQASRHYPRTLAVVAVSLLVLDFSSLALFQQRYQY
jgi:hypothetical protein